MAAEPPGKKLKTTTSTSTAAGGGGDQDTKTEEMDVKEDEEDPVAAAAVETQGDILSEEALNALLLDIRTQKSVTLQSCRLRVQDAKTIAAAIEETKGPLEFVSFFKTTFDKPDTSLVGVLNAIGHTDAHISRLRFEYQQLSRRCLLALASVIKHSKFITSLEMTVVGEKLSTQGLRALSAAIATTTAPLAVLDFDTFIEDTADICIPALVAGLGKTRAPITSFSLLGTQCGDAGAEALADALYKTNAPLACLNLSTNDFTPKAITMLCDGLSQTRAPLTTLLLDAADLDDVRMKSLITVINTQNIPLEVLSVGDNHFSINSLAKLVKALVKNAPRLTTIDLHHNKLGVAGALEVANLIIDTKAPLACVKLYDNDITDCGLAYLTAAMAETKAPLSELWLDGNQIDDDGAKALAATITTAKVPLTTLKLRNNPIGDAGVIALVENLGSLKDLDLARTLATDTCVPALIKALGRVPLKRLGMFGTKISFTQRVLLMAKIARLNFNDDDTSRKWWTAASLR